MRKRRRVILVGFALTFLLAGSSLAANVMGSGSRDVIRGTAKADELYGLRGNDRIYGGRGTDLLIGSFGNDLLSGGPGKDVLLGAEGRDRLEGGPGMDTMLGGKGSDLLVAKDGFRDLVDCGPGKDQIIRDPFDHVENCEKKKIKPPAGGYGGAGGTSGSGGFPPPPPPAAAPPPAAPSMRLGVRADNGGTIASAPNGISCPGRCTAMFAPGTRVSLRATPQRNWLFTGWAGSCSGNAPTCSLTLSQHRWARAMFRPASSVTPPPPPPPPPPPAPPPPPPPPSPGSGCSTTNYSSWSWQQCRVGTTITVTNSSWHCNRPLSSYGPLPIKVISTAAGAWDDAGAVTVNSGCTGSPGTDVNLIVDIRGDGPSSSGGNGQDAFKTRENPENLRITGSIQCGRRAPGAHQDSIQIQGGTNITFVNVEAGGNYDAGTSTCMGAGGGPFYSLNAITNVDILGGKYISCNHALNGRNAGSGPGNDVSGAHFRTGRREDPNCAGFAISPPCLNTGALSLSGLVCEQWVGGRWVGVPPG